jgi:hypothetical protein
MTQDATGDKASPAGPKAPRGPVAVPRPLLYATAGILAALILLVLGMYAWKTTAVRGVERRMESQRVELTAARQKALESQARGMLRLAGRPLAWAVRAEMLRNNLEQVDDYFNDFVREPGIVGVVLIGKEGTVLLATNRKLVGQPALDVVSKTVLEATGVTVEESGGVQRLAVPVMSFNERLAVLAVDYVPARGEAAQAPTQTLP